jgi:hypothetical protein
VDEPCIGAAATAFPGELRSVLIILHHSIDLHLTIMLQHLMCDIMSYSKHSSLA